MIVVKVWMMAMVVGLAACASGEGSVTPDGFGPNYWDVGLFESKLDSVNIIGPCSQCDDNKPCTRDLCQAGGGCINENMPAGFNCDDNNACTSFDQCDGQGSCAGGLATDVVYRYHSANKDTYYYARTNTGGPSGYVFTGELFRIRREGDPLTQSLYRLSSTKTYEFMLTLSAVEGAACCGYQNNGVIGGIFPKQQPGTVPLYRLKKGEGATLRHISTLDAQERSSDGFVLEPVQGYVCPL